MAGSLLQWQLFETHQPSHNKISPEGRSLAISSCPLLGRSGIGEQRFYPNQLLQKVISKLQDWSQEGGHEQVSLCMSRRRRRTTRGRVSRDQPECVMEGAGQREPQGGQEDSGKGMERRWEAQWQHFLQTLQSNDPAWGSPPVSDPTPWDDAKAFLASFEQVAAACHWPGAEWVARLLPALSGEARQTFMLLEARDKEDYGKVKAAILRDEALRREKQRQHFRQFCCQELEDPRKIYVQIQALCCQWLQPERHTKKQILELLVLEQFLTSLPVEAQTWIQARGPDSCAQAVALLEDFLMSRKEAEMGTWQEPMQELAVCLLDAKEEHLDIEISKEHAEMFRDTNQNINGEVTVPETGVIPPEDQDMIEAELTKGLGVHMNQMLNTRKMGLPLHMVERRFLQSSQQTTFWKVLQEDGENADCLEDGKGNRLKVKNAQAGGNEPVEIARSGQGEPQENMLMRAEMMDGRCESNSEQEQELLLGCQESGKRTEGLVAACGNPSPVDPEGPKAMFSKYGRRYRPKFKQHSSQMDREKYGGLEFEERLHSNSSAEHQIICTGEETYNCADCGKGFSLRSTLLRHHKIHTTRKSHKYYECGKSFYDRSHLFRHEMIHTGKKTFQCPECGKNFFWRSHLLSHEKVHTGEKHHQCPECGKNFSWRSNLLRHEKMHTGEKPHKCPECGKDFSSRSSLLRHEKVHTGEKPHKCNECGKNFSHKSHLLSHEKVHTGEKPHQCPECGKNFPRRPSLMRHKMMHTGEKPHK